MPLPVPLAPESIVIQEVLVVAVQAQPDVVVTPTVLAPPAASGLADVGLTLKLQGTENEKGLD